MKKILFFIAGMLMFISSGTFAESAGGSDTLTNQTIVYKTKQAGKLYLVWANTNWEVPAKEFLPEGSYVNNGMAYSPFKGEKDSFYIELKLPLKSYVNFMIYAPKDEKGEDADSWDTNWGSNYNLFADGRSPVRIYTDEKLYASKKTEKETDITEKGILFAEGCAGLMLLMLIVNFLFKGRDNFNFSGKYFVFGLIMSAYLLMAVLRLQMNGYLNKEMYLFSGVSLQDLVFLAIITAVILLLMYFTRNKKVLKVMLEIFAVLFILVIVLCSILNVKVVKELGKPINYNWLYVSDFFRSVDVKNAAVKEFSGEYIRNLLFIYAGLATAGYGFSVVLRLLRRNVKRYGIVCVVIFTGVISTGIVQQMNRKFDKGKTDNPLTVLLVSGIEAGKTPPMLSMKVSDGVKEEIRKMHSNKTENINSGVAEIKNIIFFVMESVPVNYVQYYDSTYKVTPHLDEWRKSARVFRKMYAPLPNSISTLLAIVSGIYPAISFRSIVNERSDIKTKSLPGMLRENGWKTSIFFSSDLTYSNIDKYVNAQQVETAEDLKTIECEYKKFESNYALLDGLDDRCIVKKYLDWERSNSGDKKLSILWTNQTHHPYFYAEKEKQYSEKPELNTYLNALSNIDEAFGMLMSGLEKEGKLNETLVIAFGDHGEAFGTHNQYTHASNIYEENIHVPFMLINPLMFKGEEDTLISEMTDVPPTAAGLTGMTAAEEWEGENLLGEKRRDRSFFLAPFSSLQAGTRSGDWKVIYNATENTFQLYNLRNDPGELRNIADENPDIIKREYEYIAGWAQYHSAKVNAWLPGFLPDNK
jgi:arylsulfatase A-like enzyme